MILEEVHDSYLENIDFSMFPKHIKLIFRGHLGEQVSIECSRVLKLQYEASIIGNITLPILISDLEVCKESDDLIKWEDHLNSMAKIDEFYPNGIKDPEYNDLWEINLYSNEFHSLTLNGNAFSIICREFKLIKD